DLFCHRGRLPHAGRGGDHAHRLRLESTLASTVFILARVVASVTAGRRGRLARAAARKRDDSLPSPVRSRIASRAHSVGIIPATRRSSSPFFVASHSATLTSYPIARSTSDSRYIASCTPGLVRQSESIPTTTRPPCGSSSATSGSAFGQQ